MKMHSSFNLLYVLAVVIVAQNISADAKLRTNRRRLSFLSLLLDSLSDPTCVSNDRQLRDAVRVAQRDPSKPRTKITLCRPTILVSNIVDPVQKVTGIDLSNRYIDLRCKYTPSGGICALDGQKKSRIFFGKKANFTAQNVDFINAKSDDTTFHGGALSFHDKSTVTLNFCSFKNNSASYLGGAIFLHESVLTIKGGSRLKPVNFSDNVSKNYAGALNAISSTVTIKDVTVFSKNTAGSFGAIQFENTSASLKSVSFLANNATKGSVGAMELVGSTVYMEDILFKDNFASYDTAAIQAINSSMTLNVVNFVNNKSPSGGAMSLYLSKMSAIKSSFSRNNVVEGAINAEKSKATLKECTFSKNKGALGSNIYIVDNVKPSLGGTMIVCETAVVFCNGLGSSSIYDVSPETNTDCSKKGIPGTPGVGVCPK